MVLCRHNCYCILWRIMSNRCPMTDRVNGSPNAIVYWPMWDRWAVYDCRVQCLYVSTMMMGLMLRRRFVNYLLQIGWHCCSLCCPWMVLNHLRNGDMTCSIDDSPDRRHQCYCWMWCVAQNSIFGTMCPATTINMYYFLLSDMMRSAYYFQCLVDWMRLLGRFEATWVARFRFDCCCVWTNFPNCCCRH